MNDIGIVSATTRDQGMAEASRKTRALKRLLRSFGYHYQSAEGFYTYENGQTASEASVLVPHLKRRDAITLGIVFEQESVIADMRLISTKSGSIGKTLVKFHGIKRGKDVPKIYKNYTIPQHGVPFAFV